MQDTPTDPGAQAGGAGRSGPPIRAAGGVVWRRAGADVEVAVVYRPKRRDWTLPKGKLDGDETEVEAAVREIAEETGQAVRLGRDLGSVRYDVEMPDGPRRKIVRYWAMESLGGTFAANREVAELRWLTPAAAEPVLTRDTDRNVLERFAHGPAMTGRVLLLRHAEAVAAHLDPQRDLDAVGRRRAVRLAAALACFAPDELRASPSLRCTRTLAPLAAATGLELCEEPVLSEDGFAADPGKAHDLVAGLAAAQGTAVVCTHAPVIAELLSLAATSNPGLLPRPARLEPGGAWSLEYAGDRLVGMAYLPPPPLPDVGR